MKLKKLISLGLASVLALSLAACGGSGDSSSSSEAGGDSSSSSEAAGGSDLGAITVITREDGSGTRGAFTEITGIDDGENGDRTTLDAVVQDGTGKVMTAVASDPAAIGYISLGSLDDSVKAVMVDGVEATVENINSGEYKVARPFNIATLTGTDLDAVSQELIDFIFTAEAQAIVEGEGFIAVEATTASFESTQPEGTIVVGGSTSVYPVMEKLVEAYRALNPNATITIEGIGSSAGMNGAIDGSFSIGMASRDLKDSELESLTPYVIAMDGIAVVVNNENSLSDISMEQIMNIYIGEITDYSELN